MSRLSKRPCVVRRPRCVGVLAALLLLCVDGSARGQEGSTLFERLQQDRAGLRAGLESMRSYAWGEDWYAQLGATLESTEGGWVPVRQGWCPTRAMRYAFEWNRPAPGRELALSADFELEPHPYTTIVDLHRQLLASQIELLLVPIPTRLCVYPEYAFPADSAPSSEQLGADFRGYAQGTTQLLLALSEAGVEVIDLLPEFAERRFEMLPAAASDIGEAGEAGELWPEAFLSCNSHWTPGAASLAAQLAAQRVRQLPGWRDVDAGLSERGSAAQLALGPLEVSYEPGFSTSPRGSLLPVGAMPDRLLYERVLRPDGSAPDFDDAASPVLVIGDSFVKYFDSKSASFGAHLAAQLGHKVDLISVSGGGVLQARSALARRRENGLESKRVLIWLFTAASFVDGKDWRPLELLK